MVNYIAIAIPVFFALIGIEALVAHWQGKRVYRFNDAVTDLSCGIGQQVAGLFTKAVLFVGKLGPVERLLNTPSHHLGRSTASSYGLGWYPRPIWCCFLAARSACPLPGLCWPRDWHSASGSCAIAVCSALLGEPDSRRREI